MIEDTMTLLSLLGRIMRYFLLRPETLFLLCISLALWSYFFHTDEVKTIVKSSRDAVKMVKGKVAEMMQNERFGGLDVLDAEFAKTWELKSHNVAVYSIQGRRDHMEDRYDVLADVINKTHPSIFGIFDGHGGEAAADYAKAHLPEALRQQLLTYERERERNREKDKEKNGKTEGMSYPSILEQQILMLDREMLEKLSATYNEAGTTCLVALLSDKELTVANVGDSRGVLCDKDGNAIPLSHDHKPYQLKERKRIKKAGGFISFNGSWRVQGILAMSRSLGDYTLKNLNVVIPDPDVLSFDLNKLQPEFMILASDGLWDTFSNEEAVRFVRERLDEPHFGAKSIVLQSYYRGCPDNITVMVVKFKGKTGAQ
ncbi:protein phosphatase, Mg2+/Mn2+ dependent, 1Lb isoform X1 [Phyllopteryx taeniolatus]|uniref:protein phosphatase, Mg2+/Mn2+ dependent, 1Lb isoform X1 n=3 Tax=Phyllopteryx taeniolatus TaxID=161469 RepID=UPI002AD261FD|nr:protein phosphatase, Mg2+/Mn2+ dependent, 1Lb isoform X1 [Phyllopteryx taeniolatus]XP_061638948.1 protein phosphatase, Mg2+/Mn2+ dependent, 1Lb isoform X1 [Phyllopteryx taeniolatus]